MVVLDLLARDPGVTRITLVEPDVYKPHNVHRHVFSASAVGQMKADLAAAWVRERRQDIGIEAVIADLTDQARQAEFARYAAECDVGVCAVDNEPAKYAFDTLMRQSGKPWTLGEVLSGGIGGWVHRFTPRGPCYGCVASYLQRTVAEEPTPQAPDYSNPGGAVPETTVPANKASIGVIASLHAVVTLELLANRECQRPEVVGTSGEFTSLLFTLAKVPQVFEEAFRPYRFRIPKSPGCLVCGTVPAPIVEGDLDVAVGEALGRLAPQ
jgi:molybdopterin/thiamine biosynthesis adenylyltransferase